MNHQAMRIRSLKSWIVARVQPVLARRFGDERSSKVLDDAFSRYAGEAPGLPKEASLGGRLMVHCAALTAALYRVLLDEGMEESEARSLTAEVTTAIYDRMAAAPWLLARLSARSPMTRLRRATSAFRRFPFGPPAYRMEDVSAGARTVAFDVKRCPVAEYFRSQGLADLCVDAFCNLDFPLAVKWGARLERTGTLAGGSDHCDFRWHVLAEEEAAP